MSGKLTREQAVAAAQRDINDAKNLIADMVTWMSDAGGFDPGITEEVQIATLANIMDSMVPETAIVVLAAVAIQRIALAAEE